MILVEFNVTNMQHKCFPSWPFCAHIHPEICAHNSIGPTLGSRFSTAHITSLLMLYDSLQGAPTTRKSVRTTVFASLWEADDQLVGNVLSTSTSFLCAQPYSQAGTSVKYNYWPGCTTVLVPHFRKLPPAANLCAQPHSPHFRKQMIDY